MSNKRLIEDSEEVREAIADLQSKVNDKKTENQSEHNQLNHNMNTSNHNMNTANRNIVDKTNIQNEKKNRNHQNNNSHQNNNYQNNNSQNDNYQNGNYENDNYRNDDFQDADYQNDDNYEGSYEDYAHEEDYSYEETEEYYEEDIAADSFEEVIDQTCNMKGTIADAYEEQRETRRLRREQFAESKYDGDKLNKTKKKSKSKKDEDVIISLENVTKSYVKGVPALNNVNIKIKRGEFVFIVGGSGSGKSTLIKLLLRELKPNSGSIMVNGFQVDKLRNWKVPKLRRSMGVVFQDFRLLMDRNVYENVAFAQRIIQTPAREMKKNVPNILSLVGLAGMYKKRPDELSGGEQQRVALARALVNRPPILLADEPTGNLDPANTKEMMNLLERINEKGTTVVVVTHDDKVVDAMQKRVITIRKGIIVSDEKKGGYIND